MKLDKRVDNKIAKVFREHCSDMEFDYKDAPRIFEEGRKAYAEGKDLKEALISFVRKIKKV